MNIDWVREIDRQCRETETPHFFKQYYESNRGVAVTNGMLDGVIRQEFPVV